MASQRCRSLSTAAAGRDGSGVSRIRVPGPSAHAFKVKLKRAATAQDLIISAINEASDKSEALREERQKQFMGGMGLPPGLTGF